MASSPVVIPFTTDGVEIGATDGLAIPANARGFVGVGYDGTNLRFFRSDTSGRQIMVGAAAEGSAVAGNPVRVAGSDGTNARTLRTATDGTLRIDPTGTTTQPVSAASLPLPTGAATSANQTTLGSQTTEINDGTRTATIKAASTAAVAADTALVVAISPNSKGVTVEQYLLGAGGSATWNNATSVNATVLVGSANDPTATISIVRTGTISSGVITFEGSDANGVWFPVLATRVGAFTAESSFDLTAAADTEWKLNVAGFFDTRVRLSTVITGAGSIEVASSWDASPSGDTRAVVGQSDETKLNATATLKSGAKGSSAAALVTSTASGSNHQPVDVAIYDAAGNQITSFGGGTQYVEDVAAPTDPTGTAKVMVRADTPATVATTDGDWVTQRSTNYGAGYVQVVTSAGAFVDTFGGGTQFADGAARGTATGTLAMVDDGTLIQSTAGDSSGRQIIVGAAADGAAVAGNPLLIGGTDGANARAVNVDSTGALRLQSGGTTGAAVPSRTTQVGGSDGTNLRTLRTATDGTVRTDPTGTTTQPVSGTVTANIGTSGSLALDATLTGGTAEAIIRGGAKGATVAADITSTAEGVDHQAVDVQIYHGGTAVNPTAIRALTSSDVVTAAQGTAAALAGFWPVKVTDGTNSMPTMDTVGRRGFVTITDGTNALPTGDAVARSIFVRQTDGTNNATIKAANVTATAADTGIVVAPRASATGTQTSVASSATSVQLLAANTARIGAVIFNDSTQVCFVKFGTTASATSFAYRLTSNSTMEVPYGYTGRIDAIWNSANGNARITEMT